MNGLREQSHFLPKTSFLHALPEDTRMPPAFLTFPNLVPGEGLLPALLSAQSLSPLSIFMAYAPAQSNS